MIELAQAGRVVTLTLTDALDYHAVEALAGALDGIDASAVDRVIVELAKGGAFDDGAVGLLVRTGARLRSAGARLVLCGADARTADALRGIGADRVVALAESRDEALVG